MSSISLHCSYYKCPYFSPNQGNTKAVCRGPIEQVIWLRQGYTGRLQRQVQGMDFTGVHYSNDLQRRGYREGWEQLF